jgi:hypothetical protein
MATLERKWTTEGLLLDHTYAGINLTNLGIEQQGELHIYVQTPNTKAKRVNIQHAAAGWLLGGVGCEGEKSTGPQPGG